MSEYNWCHGPTCHTNDTQDRLRGVKGSKVLRTRKVPVTEYHRNSFYKYFCSNGCYNSFANKHIEQIVALAPRTEALETPVNVVKEQARSWSGRDYMETKIIRVDNNVG